MTLIIHPDAPAGTAKQYARVGNQFWSVSRLIKLTEGFEVMEIPIAHLMLEHKIDLISLREFARRVIQVNEADLSYPIILDEDGVIMDGRHRLTKAIIEKRETIKAVRFQDNPVPCRAES